MEVDVGCKFQRSCSGVNVMSNILGNAMSVQASGSSNTTMEAQRTQWTNISVMSRE